VNARSHSLSKMHLVASAMRGPVVSWSTFYVIDNLQCVRCGYVQHK
jgi:hypothetical protein